MSRALPIVASLGVGLLAVSPLWPSRAATAAQPTTGAVVGNPPLDFSPPAGSAGEATIFFWVDANGVTHFTDETDDFPSRIRDRFQPIDLFLTPSGQSKR